MAEALIVSDVETAVARIVERTGPAIVAAAPLGLGKPNRLLNALYARVAGDASMSLTLYTALSLARPTPSSDLERRFAGPFIARHFGDDYPDLAYVAAMRANALPANVRVQEFYFQSGAMLGREDAQQSYASLNYTHVARDVAQRGVNVVVQMVARRGDRLSYASNPDVTVDLLDRIARAGQPKPLLVCVVNEAMPFVGHDAEFALDQVDVLLDHADQRLFALPREPVAPAEFALGLHASSLVVDGGTLQIGIGALSDALVHALLLRQRGNDDYRGALAALRGTPSPPAVVREQGGEAPLARGLYGASEMVMDGFMHLRRAGILTRRVFDDLALQRLLNAGTIGETTDAATLDRLVEAGLVPAALDRDSVAWLVRFGLLDEGARVADGTLTLADTTPLSANLLDDAARAALARRIAGRRLRGGRYLHGAFFLGSRELYRWLGALDGDDFDGLAMTRVSHINELYGGREQLDIAQRAHARFFNTCMMHTLLGAAVSDGLDTGQVVSGVGGQYNFVAMAHALEDGRSILMLRATRAGRDGLRSNLVYQYGHATIPRHLRDIVITEYGIADLRGEPDAAVIERLLAISDARFVDGLVDEAKRAGKLARGFVVPDAWRRNTPAAITAALAPYRQRGLFPRHPFGNDFEPVEQRLVDALGRLKRGTASWPGKLGLVARAVLGGAPKPAHREALARLDLARPRGMAQHLTARLVARALEDDDGALH